MPEGPEVLITAQYLFSKIKHCEVNEIKILGGKYSHKELSGKHFLNGTTRYTLMNINTKGKLLWFTMVNNKNKQLFLLSHFGLTGGWSFDKSKDNKIELKLTKNNEPLSIYYDDPRNFGSVMITDDQTTLTSKLNKLAPDFLQESFSDDDFYSRIKTFLNKSKKRSNVLLGKLLMRQNKSDGIGSGIGNYLAPEIMYDAKISPLRTIGSLSKMDIFALAHSIKYIIKLSYFNNKTGYMANFGTFTREHKKGIQSGLYPDYHPDIILKSADAFEFKVYRQKVDPYGNEVKIDKTINDNRSTYWVPNVQK